MFMPYAALLAALLSAVQGSAAAQSPLVGSWTANLAKSKLHPGAEYQSVSLQISVSADTITMASEIVTTSGQTQRAAETFRTDGKETPGTLTPAVALMAKWLGPDVLASVARKNGETFVLVIYQVSTDGRTLTSRSSGAIEQTVVFERR
jgi:hypothetical protein